MELRPGGLRERAGRESKGRWGPGLGAPDMRSRVAGRPSTLCGPRIPAPTPKRGRRDRRRHRDTVSPASPPSQTNSSPSRGGWWGERGAGLPGEIFSLPSKLPGTPIRGSSSGWTIARGPSPPRVSPPLPAQPTNQTTSPKRGLLPASARLTWSELAGALRPGRSAGPEGAARGAGEGGSWGGGWPECAE